MSGKGTGLWRVRVGTEHRVVYQIFESRLLVLIVRVGHRSIVYSGLERFARDR